MSGEPDNHELKDSSADLPPVEQYAGLLDEARRIQGVSLWQDAWRRLRKSRVAMISLYFLIAIALLAFLTPLLPLQSPLDKDLAYRQFLAPNTDPVRLGGREGLQFKDRSLVAHLQQYEEDLAKLERKLESAASSEQRDELTGQIERQRQNNPIEQLWHDPGPLTELMIRARLAMFGDWAIPSVLGTDALGRDLLARVLWGARVSLVVGLVATLVSLLIGVSYGATAGYLGGRTDNVMMRVVDVLYSVPFIFVVIFIITILRAEENKERLEKLGIDQIMVFYVIIGAIYWLTMSRVVRGQVISLKNEQFIEAAKTIGARRHRIIFRHLIPNVMGIVIVYLTLTIPAVMLFEAFLSFLGLGVEAPDVSWGLLVNEGIQVITPVKTYWWLVLFPGLTLTLTLFALNFLGDGLRDALDPRMKNR